MNLGEQFEEGPFMRVSKPDILERLGDLSKQASVEKSHYYTASVLIDAIHEIASLRIKLGAATALKAGHREPK